MADSAARRLARQTNERLGKIGEATHKRLGELTGGQYFNQVNPARSRQRRGGPDS